MQISTILWTCLYYVTSPLTALEIILGKKLELARLYQHLLVFEILSLSSIIWQFQDSKRKNEVLFYGSLFSSSSEEVLCSDLELVFLGGEAVFPVVWCDWLVVFLSPDSLSQWLLFTFSLFSGELTCHLFV